MNWNDLSPEDQRSLFTSMMGGGQGQQGGLWPLLMMYLQGQQGGSPGRYIGANPSLAPAPDPQQGMASGGRALPGMPDNSGGVAIPQNDVASTQGGMTPQQQAVMQYFGGGAPQPQQPTYDQQLYMSLMGVSDPSKLTAMQRGGINTATGNFSGPGSFDNAQYNNQADFVNEWNRLYGGGGR